MGWWGRGSKKDWDLFVLFPFISILLAYHYEQQSPDKDEIERLQNDLEGVRTHKKHKEAQ